MENNKWVIGLDLDGTTLSEWDGKLYEDGKPKETINELTKEGIRLAQEAGHTVVLTTGRSWYQTSKVYEELKLNSFVINDAGAHIHIPGNKEFEPIRDAVPHDTIKALLEDSEVKSNAISYTLDLNDQTYIYDNEHSSFTDYAILNWGAVLPKEGNTDLSTSCVVIWFKLSKDEVLTIRDSLVTKYGDIAAITQWDQINDGHNYGLEINPKKTNKGTSLLKVAELLNIPASNTLAIGDAENDMPMLEKAGRSVVMKNGFEHVKALADDITDLDNKEGGVGDYLIKFFKLK